MIRYGNRPERLVRRGAPTRCYYVRTYDTELGTRSWACTGCRKLRDAEDWIQARQREVAMGTDRAAAEKAARTTFAEAFESWIESKKATVGAMHHRNLESLGTRYWLPYFGGMRLADLDAERIRIYLAKRKAGVLPASKKEASATTVNQDRKDLSGFFGYCRRQGWLAADPVFGVDRYAGEVRRKTRYISRKEEQKLLAACRQVVTREVEAVRNKGGRRGGRVSRTATKFSQSVVPPAYLYPLVLTAVRCGFRRATLLRLRWRHADLESAIWEIPGENMKSGRDYDAPIPESVKQALVEYRDLLAAKWVAHGKDPRDRIGPDALIFGLSKTTKIRRSFDRAVARAGLKITFHDLRRIFLNRCREAGVSIETAMRLSDHRSLKVVLEHYREIRQSEVEDAVRALDGCVSSGVSSPSAATKSPAPSGEASAGTAASSGEGDEASVVAEGRDEEEQQGGDTPAPPEPQPAPTKRPRTTRIRR